MRTMVFEPATRSILKQSFENSASHAVRDARGIVAASAREMLLGTRNAMRSSARVYSLYAPRPLVSPALIRRDQQTRKNIDMGVLV